jgi:hypothetical protein
MGVKCSNCGWPLPEKDPYCHRCGTNNAPLEVKKEHVCTLDFNGLPVPAPVRNAFQLLGSEKVVGLWRCRSFDEERSRAGHQSSMAGVNGLDIAPLFAGADVKADGLLLLTNGRLVFLRESYRLDGLVRTNERAYSLTYVLDLAALVGLDSSDGPLILKVKRDEVNFRRVILSRIFQVSPERLVTVGPIPADEAKADLQQLLDRYWKEVGERDGNTVQVLVDFSFLKDTLERGGIVLRSSKCPNCGSLIDLPEGGTSVRCEYCGGALQAIDVLDRLRALMGDIKAGRTV